MKRYINPRVYEVFGEVPPYYIKITRDKVVVRAGSDWDGYKDYEITIEDVARYFACESGNLLSGFRSLGGLVGDWRQVDYLAHEILQIFKAVNINKLRRVCRSWGLEPRF